MSPQALVSQMNRATAEVQKTLAEEEGLAPVLAWIKALVDAVLAEDFDPGLEFSWAPTATMDPEAQERMLTSYTSRGILTLNEARAALGRDPLPDRAADAAMVLTAGGYVGLAGGAAAAKLAKGDDWDAAKHPRWSAGSPDRQGGRFAPGGSDASTVAAADDPADDEGGVCVPLKLNPPGDCTVEQHRDLQERMENACGAAKACVGGESPEVLQYKIARHYECLQARMRISETCFRGGDDRHRNAIAERYNAIRNCWRIGGGVPR